jgi:lysophospholipid acyltransferase (LPLAT)-like uncharacterized protein
VSDGAQRSGFSVGQKIMLAVVPPLVALLLRIIGSTLRFEEVVEQGAVPARPPAKGIFCFWHRCTLPCAWYFRKFRCSIIISQSFDGELIARTLALFGFNAVRGSSSRGGGQALWELKNVIEAGSPAVFTADGPRGPIYQTKAGPVKLAQVTGAEMGSFYLLPEKAWVMQSWDRFLVPKPFSRVAVSWARAVAAPAGGATPEELEQKRQELEAALERARAAAERHFGLRDLEAPGDTSPARKKTQGF